MANNFDNNIKPVKFGSLDAIFDERGSAYLALRRIQWVKEGSEPDESKAKLEIRRWRVSDEGERAERGVAFLTDEGPNELAKVLVHEGFGKTKDILSELRRREDFKEVVENFNNNTEDSGEYFDMRSLFETDIEDEEEDDASVL